MEIRKALQLYNQFILSSTVFTILLSRNKQTKWLIPYITMTMRTYPILFNFLIIMLTYRTAATSGLRIVQSNGIQTLIKVLNQQGKVRTHVHINSG